MALLHRSSYHTAFLSINLDIEPQLRYKSCLQKIHKVPTYQYIIVGFVIFFYALIVFNAMIGYFVFMNPLVECQGVGVNQEEACNGGYIGYNGIYNGRDEGIDRHKGINMSINRRIDVDMDIDKKKDIDKDIREGDLGKCVITNNFTAAYRNQLYCEKQVIRSTIQGIFGFGFIVGKVSFPVISDIIGRRKSILIGLLIGVAAMSSLLLGIEYYSETAMILGQLLAGIFGSGIATLTFIYVCDFCTDRIREFCLTHCWSIMGIIQMFFYVLYFYFPNWKLYLTATIFIPISVLFILVLFFQIESPVYAIFVKKNPQAFDEIVDQVSKYSKISSTQKSTIRQQGRRIIQILKTGDKNEIRLKQVLQKIFCNKKNLKIVLCLISINLGYIFFFYGVQGSMESLGYNFGVNMFLCGLMQFFGFISAGYLTRRLRRKPVILVTVLVSSVSGLLFLFQFVQEGKTLQTILVVVARLSAGYVFCFFIILESQILEVEIRNTSFSLIDGTGQAGRIVSPYVINFMYNIKLHPIIAFSIVFITFSALPVLLLRQTFQKQVSQIVKDQSEKPKSFSESSALFQQQSSRSSKVKA